MEAAQAREPVAPVDPVGPAQVPAVLWQAANRVGTIVFLVVMLIAVPNKEAAKAISD